MQKLNEELAQWLIDKIDEGDLACIPTTNFDATLAGVSHERARFRRLIKQCTEKEFPDFCCEAKMGGFIEVKNSGKDSIVLWMKDSVADTYSNSLFTQIQFKQFTEGCQKIVEWLDEQKDAPWK